MTRDAPPLHTALTGCMILAFAMGIGRFAFTPLLPMMQDEGLLSISGGGTLASVHFIGYAMGALLARYLAPFPGPALFTSLAAIGLGTLAMGLTESYAIWLAARWIAGLCSAFVLVVVSTHFMRLLSEAGRPDLQGWVFAGVGTGIAIAGLATLWFTAAGISSPAAWLIFGAATLAATAIILTLPPHQSFTGTSAPAPSATSSTRLPWHLILPYGAMGAGYVIPATYLPVMAQQAAASPGISGWGWPAFGLAAAISTLASARLHTVFSNRLIWIVSQGVMALGLLLPVFWPHIASILLSGLCVGGTFMVITMAGIREAHRLAAPGHAQHAIAAMTAAFAIGQIIGPLAAGWAYSLTTSFSHPLLLATAALIVTMVPITRAAPEPRALP